MIAMIAVRMGRVDIDLCWLDSSENIWTQSRSNFQTSDTQAQSEAICTCFVPGGDKAK